MCIRDRITTASKEDIVEIINSLSDEEKEEISKLLKNDSEADKRDEEEKNEND